MGTTARPQPGEVSLALTTDGYQSQSVYVSSQDKV